MLFDTRPIREEAAICLKFANMVFAVGEHDDVKVTSKELQGTPQIAMHVHK